jgi:4-hydroxybenzoate polyprenyltransferase
MSAVGTRLAALSRTVPSGATRQRQQAPARIAGLTLSMLRYRVAIMVWTFMLLGAASGDGAHLKGGELALEACALAWSYVAATTVNDLADVEIDLVNHPGDVGRPLVVGAASPADMRKLHWIAWAAAIGCATPLGAVPAGLVVVGLVIGRAYSLRPLRLSYRPYWAPSTLAIAYVVVPYTLGFWSSGGETNGRAVAIGGGLVALFLARIVLKDFRDREGDAIFGRRSLLLLHGKRMTCALSGGFAALGDGSLSLAFGGHAWPLLLLAQGFFAAVGRMLWSLSKATTPTAEQVAIGTGAKMANGLLFSLLSWLLLSGHGATIGMRAAFLVLLAALYGTSFVTLARRPERAVIGYKG